MLQVIRVKPLTLLFGVSGQAVALTLSIFMLGLALGAHAGGQLAEHTARPLLLFALTQAELPARPPVFSSEPQTEKKRPIK